MDIQVSPAAKALVDHLHDCDRQAGYRMESVVAPLPGLPPKDVTLFVPIRLLRDLETEFLAGGKPDPVTAWTADRKEASQAARAQGFTGDACPHCGNFAMRRAGSCATCTACGETTGCS